MKKDNYSAWQGLVRALSLPEDSFVSKSRLEVLGKNKLTVDGVNEILEYSDRTVLVSGKEGRVLIEGDDLRVDMFIDKVIMICGDIQSIIFD